MQLTISDFQELYNIGLLPIPIIWDIEKRQALVHPRHIDDTANGIPSIDDVSRWMDNGFSQANGIALKLLPPFGMFDFDLKNTSNKEVYSQWFAMVEATNPDVLSKCCIEKTRNGGYHFYIKSKKLSHKIQLASAIGGAEVISLYTGGLLSYCYPSPGYELIHNDFNDIQELTDKEFEMLVAAAASFNEDKESEDFFKNIITDYPIEYESTCLQFDQMCPDDMFEKILNSIGLYDAKVKNNRKKYTAFLRDGSEAAYSAKVYFKSKHVLLFTSSIAGFPSWHNKRADSDNSWILTPSRLLYYKYQQNWIEAINKINEASKIAKIDIAAPADITVMPIKQEADLQFPLDIFPDEIRNYIEVHNIQHDYMAAAALAAISAALGNSVRLQAMDGYIVKPLLYLAVVAPPGSSKSPAQKAIFHRLQLHDDKLYQEYQQQKEQHRIACADAKKQRMDEPAAPAMKQILIDDSTIEMVAKILKNNPEGCCVLADELSGFLSRMNRYGESDEIQKWLGLWDGNRLLIQRITREEDKVKDPFCTVFGGIQPGVLELLSKGHNKHNGFYHRFLFVYPRPQNKRPWKQMIMPENAKLDYEQYFAYLLKQRADRHIYALTLQANDLYERWFNNKNQKYNASDNDDVKGIISKYQDYCLRFALLLQAAEDGRKRGPVVMPKNMERAIRLTEYFLGNMHKATKILVPENPADAIPGKYQAFYNELPVMFTTKTLLEISAKYKIKPASAKNFIYRDFKHLFVKNSSGNYEKLY